MIPIKKQGDSLRAVEVNEIVSDLNAVLLATRDDLARNAALGRFASEPANACNALNDDTVDIPNYCPVAITGHVDDPETNRVIKITLPDATSKGRFGIVGPGIAENYVGRVYLSGVCLCKVKTASGDICADVAAAGDTFLTGSPTTGAAEILWEDGGASSTAHLALIRFPRGGSSPDVVCAKAKSSSSLTHSGTQTIDGVSCGAGDLVFDDPDVWEVAAGAWTKRWASPKAVIVAKGTSNGPDVWAYDGTSYVALIARTPASIAVKAKSVSTLTHSGTQTVDGQACGVGDLVLDGTTIWQVASGAWTNKYSNIALVVTMGGTVNGPLMWVYTGSAYQSIGTWS